MADLALVHRYVPAPDGRAGPTLLLLHGTGGDENDLVPLGGQLAPDAALLGVRGSVLEGGMPRFFRRIAPGVFDEDDLVRRTHELADFVAASATAYGFDPARVIAAGYSNGANIAASVMLLRPETLRDAILFRAMRPFRQAPPIIASAMPRAALILAGRRDQMVPPGDAEGLANDLRAADVEATVHWSPAGHELTAPELSEAKRWLAERLATW